MNTTAATLALLGWQPYTRHCTLYGGPADRIMLLGETRMLNDERYYRMVMGWPEVVSGEKCAVQQIISAGTVRKECKAREWDTIPHSQLKMLAAPILERLDK
jgi:hypothetical protein